MPYGYYYGGYGDFLANNIYCILLIPILLLSVWAQAQVSGNFKRYSAIANKRHLTGAQAAEAVLRAHGIYNVSIRPCAGSLTDHYDPRDNSISLSQDVYNSATIAAVGVAAHEAGHAVVMHALPDLDPVHQITIVPRGEAGGMTIYLPDEDRSYLSRSYMLDRIAGLLGGRAAEQLVLGDISTGASNDISRATQLARKMVGTYGMSEQLGNVAFDAGHDEVFIGKSMAQTRPYSEKTAAEMDGEIRRIMDDAYARCTAILEQYRPQLVEVAEYLLANETMTAEEFEKVFRTE